MNPATDPRPTTIQVTTLDGVVDAADGAARVAEALSDHEPWDGVLRIEQPVTDTDVLGWLAATAETERLYFASRDGELALGGLGIATSFDDGNSADAWLQTLFGGEAASALHVFVTSRFAGEADADSPWAPFGRLRLSLARVELRRTPAGTTLAAHVVDGEGVEETTRLLEATAVPGPETPSFQAVVIDETPDPGKWNEGVASTLEAIEAGTLEKCVLARTRTYALDRSVDPFALLRAAALEQPDTFVFGVQVAPDRAFVGATPELLFRRGGGAVESEALAGTRRRPADEAEDDRLAEDLLASEKDRVEHEYVTAHITEALRPLLADVPDLEGPRVRRFAGIQHLGTRVRGTLVDDASDLSLLDALHPSPALCGVPTELAHATIREHEPFDRGLYCGAVGVVGKDETIIAVGIRSALVTQDRVTLLAGAGIVAGSDPDSEWRETGDKMRALDAILRAGRAG